MPTTHSCTMKMELRSAFWVLLWYITCSLLPQTLQVSVDSGFLGHVFYFSFAKVHTHLIFFRHSSIMLLSSCTGAFLVVSGYEIPCDLWHKSEVKTSQDLRLGLLANEGLKTLCELFLFPVLCINCPVMQFISL